ncbi:transmembrane protein 134 isoform X6 [Manis javanica]|uniref:transmembrane protein 134 isoform X6 n=1 Tax=Manis javanica TaxID=9974 RepID=UPI001879A6DB|nr:transmembrane protein 134 isoform X5 [Manis javanica]
MTPSSCPWRTQALGPSPVGSPASGRCTSSAGPDSRWPTRTSSPGCATRTWRMMRMEPRPLQSRTGESAPGQDKLDSTPFDPEELPGSAGLLPAPAAGAGHISARQVPCSENTELALILIGVGLEVAPSPGVSSAIFFVPGFLLLVPGVYHVIFIYCAVKGHRGFQFFYLPYFEK